MLLVVFAAPAAAVFDVVMYKQPFVYFVAVAGAGAFNARGHQDKSIIHCCCRLLVTTQGFMSSFNARLVS